MSCTIKTAQGLRTMLVPESITMDQAIKLAQATFGQNARIVL